MQPPGSHSSTATPLPDTVDRVRNVCGAEELVAQTPRGREHRPLSAAHAWRDPLAGIRSACAIALDMHQPLIPAGREHLRTAPLIGNLQYMLDHPDIGRTTTPRCFAGLSADGRVDLGAGRCGSAAKGDARVLRHAATRVAADGRRRRARRAARDHGRRAVSRRRGWAVRGDRPWRPPSTPVQDYAPHVRAWQQHFAALFGLEALGRVRGFRPRKWRCPTIQTWRTRTCVRSWMPATAGCSCENTRSSSPTGRARAISTSRTSCRARARAASRPGSSAPVKTQGSDTK